VGDRAGLVEEVTQRVGAAGLVELGGVFAVRDEDVAWVVVAGGELPEMAVGGGLPGGVGIGGDDDRSCGGVAGGAQPFGWVGGVSDAELVMAGRVGAEPVGQVGGGPAVGVAGGVEVGGLFVEFEQAGAWDGRVAGVGVEGCVFFVVADPADPHGLGWRGGFV